MPEGSHSGNLPPIEPGSGFLLMEFSKTAI